MNEQLREYQGSISFDIEGDPADDMVRVTFTPGTVWGGEAGSFVLPGRVVPGMVEDIKRAVHLNRWRAEREAEIARLKGAS